MRGAMAIAVAPVQSAKNGLATVRFAPPGHRKAVRQWLAADAADFHWALHQSKLM